MTINPDDEGRALSRSRPQLRATDPDVVGMAIAVPATSALIQASIVTPGDWIELDLDPVTRHTSISRAVRQAVARSRGLAPDAVRLIALLDRLSRHAAESGALYCASRVTEDATGGVLVANVLMQICQSDLAPPPGAPRLPASERCARLAAVIRTDPEWAGAEVRVVPLPFVGSAVRMHIEDSAIIVQYLVPLVGGLAHVVLTFTCPCPPYARVMTELFDTMAESLVLHYE
jgi:hypothetical protein